MVEDYRLRSSQNEHILKVTDIPITRRSQVRILPPAISLSALEPVSYDWLFCCAKGVKFGLGLPGACLGVPVVSAEMHLIGVWPAIFSVVIIRLRSTLTPHIKKILSTTRSALTMFYQPTICLHSSIFVFVRVCEIGGCCPFLYTDHGNHPPRFEVG